MKNRFVSSHLHPSLVKLEMNSFVPLVLLTLPIVSNGLHLSYKKSQSTFQSYGNKLTDQVCGRDTIPGQVPFYASIEVNIRKLHFTECSGVLISNRWVLTAAQCTFSVFGPIQVVLGDGWNNKTIGVEKSYIHPDFNQQTRNGKKNNIALLLLKEPVQFSRNIQPICLPESGQDETFYGRNGTLAVWGKLNPVEAKSPSNMQITTSPIIRSGDCGKSLAKVFRDKAFIYNSLMCAGYSSDVKDVCFSLPGNPLMVNVEKHWVLTGISMNNIHVGCQDPVSPCICLTRFLRVGLHLDWIKRTVH